MDEIFVNAPRIYPTDHGNVFEYHFDPYAWDYASFSAWNALDDSFIGVKGVHGYSTSWGPMIIINENDYSGKELGAIRKFMNEVSQHPALADAFERMKANGNKIYIHNDGYVHSFNGVAKTPFAGSPWKTDYGVTSENLTGEDQFAVRGSEIHISLNAKQHQGKGFHQWLDTVVHEFLHLVVGGTTQDLEEDIVEAMSKGAVYDIFKTNGLWENDYNDYLNATQGTPGNDIITGSSVFDALHGGAGNDIIYGYGGNDILTGGTGSDDLYGGAGNDTLVTGTAQNTSNSVVDNENLFGGTGNDTYVLVGWGHRIINDTSGDDYLELASDSGAGYWYEAPTDSMKIIGWNTKGVVSIENWNSGGRIEHISTEGGAVSIASATRLGTGGTGDAYTVINALMKTGSGSLESSGEFLNLQAIYDSGIDPSVVIAGISGYQEETMF